ncbi:MAG: hypothetical protein SWO11_23845, partial [Thermodesulfobacteriota bacterium]|nr:hypothetical protein [Thermodesulfobacteriota bacterium]
MKIYRLYPFLFSLIFLAIIYFSYSNTLEVPFVFDDTQNIKGNPHIRLTSLDMSKITDAGL